jgi:hypothetical protein
MRGTRKVQKAWLAVGLRYKEPFSQQWPVAHPIGRSKTSFGLGQGSAIKLSPPCTVMWFKWATNHCNYPAVSARAQILRVLRNFKCDFTPPNIARAHSTDHFRTNTTSGVALLSILARINFENDNGSSKHFQGRSTNWNAFLQFINRATDYDKDSYKIWNAVVYNKVEPQYASREVETTRSTTNGLFDRVGDGK